MHHLDVAGPRDRRSFLQWSGAAAAAIVLAGCERSPTEPRLAAGSAPAQSHGGVTINLGTDIGILNFAYALEQLEAAFYTKVAAGLYGGANAEEESVLRDIKRHEVVHREFFKTALGGKGIPALSVNFSAVNFGSRSSVLGTALAFEDLGVAAYNGAAQYIGNTDYLFAAGKIVSVEARHASVIRDLQGESFAPDAFDPAFSFEQVLEAAAPFIATPITLANSPTAHRQEATS